MSERERGREREGEREIIDNIMIVMLFIRKIIINVRPLATHL